MGGLQTLVSSVVSVFKVPFTMFGFTFSFWDVFLWSIVAGVILSLVGVFINDR